MWSKETLLHKMPQYLKTCMKDSMDSYETANDDMRLNQIFRVTPGVLKLIRRTQRLMQACQCFNIDKKICNYELIWSSCVDFV